MNSFLRQYIFPSLALSLRRTTLTLLSAIEAERKGSQLNVFENLQPVDNFNLSLPCSSANMVHTRKNFISVFRGHLKAPAEKSREIQGMS
jgi:hypothetical protein